MDKAKTPSNDTSSANNTDQVNRRSGWDRRRIPSEGFVNLGPVGWYCRRHKERRSEDNSSTTEVK